MSMAKTGAKKSNGNKTRKSRAKRPMMIDSTERTLPVVNSVASKTGYTIQVDKLLSQQNSKMYRQGMSYHARVKVAYLNGVGSQNAQYRIWTLRKDHRTIGALRMARSIYNQAMKDELEIRPEVKSPWTDFKIKVVDGETVTWAPMEQDALLLNTKVAGGDAAGVTAYGISDSYDFSEITANDGDQRKFALITDTSGYPDTAWNVFKEYVDFLTNRADPDSASENAAYGDASPVLTEMAELADKGDEPPYSWANKILETIGSEYPQDQLAMFVHRGTISQDDSPSNFQSLTVEAPLGLIFVECTSNMSTSYPELIVECLAGDYKGVKAHRLFPKDKLLGF